MQDAFAMFDTAGDLPTISGAGTGTFYSTSSYDNGAAGSPLAAGPQGAIGGPLLHDLGRGRRLLFYAQIVTTYLAAAGASTMEVNFVSDDDSAGTNRLVLVRSAAIAKASLVAGYRYDHGSTPGKIPGRYCYAQYVIATQPPTAGKITAGLMLDVDDHHDLIGTV